MPPTVTAPRSCLECHRRKIKCDKLYPCSYCIKVKIHCHYPPPRRSRNKSGSPQTSSDVLYRIERIENTLLSLEQSLVEIRQLIRSTNPSQISPISENGLKDFHQTQPNLSYIELPNRLQTHDSTGSNVSNQGPWLSPTIISLLWQIYLERVDSVLKIGHTPTIQRLVMGFARDQIRTKISISALMFAICYAAVVTMSAEECLGECDESKDKALQRYRNGVQTYLTQAGFRQSSDMIVLQAFMIYLICGRFDRNGPDVRNLTPVAISIAKKNGLHEDKPGLTLFDIEMRHRIWWHVYILDIRTAEDFGVDPHIQGPSDHLRLPLNINDSNLHPDMTEAPQIDTGKTEMLFSLVRLQISNFARQIVFSKDFCQQNGHEVLSPLEKCKAIDNFKDEIEREHLSYCDSSIPLDYITEISSRLILAKLKLAVSKPRDRQNQHILSQECFRNTCVDILKRARLLSLYEKGKQWLWLFQTYLEWDALTYLLINLSLVPIGDGVFSAWTVAEDAYGYWKNRRDVRFDGRWKQVEEFRSQAFIARDMFQRAPSLSVQVFCNGENYEPIPSQGHDPGLQVEETDFQGDSSSASVFSTATPALPEANPTLDIPTSETGCQWSALIFERYFELLDEEQSQVTPWI